MFRSLLCSTLLLGSTAVMQAQSSQSQSSSDEQIVRDSYAKISFLCSLPPLVEAARAQQQQSAADPAPTTLDLNAGNAVPVFVLSNFHSGTVASIGEQTWGDIVTIPKANGEVLKINSNTHGLTESSGNHVTWLENVAKWAPTPNYAFDQWAVILAKKVREVVVLGGASWTTPATYTRYVSYEVNATYQGKSTGTYQAIFFFGHDIEGNEVIAPQDFITDDTALYTTSTTSAYPEGLFHSRLRETPAVSNWIQQNEKPGALCQNAKRDLCCIDGKCGLSDADVRSDLSKAVPGLQ